MYDDTTRPTATDDDTRHTLTIEDVAYRYSNAAHPRTIRTLQRYCASGHLDCLKAPTKLGDMYLATPESVARHIAELDEVSATTQAVTGRDQTRPGATHDAGQHRHPEMAQSESMGDDTPRLTAAEVGASPPYAARLEGEVEFLRGQITTKDGQIKELTERSRETNVLIGGLVRYI